MKKILLLLAISFVGYSVQAQPPKGKAKPGDSYGVGAKTTAAMPISKLPEMVKPDEKVPVVVKGEVLDVCHEKGCWMKLKVDDNTTAFVKMKDYKLFLPEAIKGKTVVVDGLAYMEVTSVDELRHYAEDAKKSQEEIDEITEPESQLRLTATGITVVKS